MRRSRAVLLGGCLLLLAVVALGAWRLGDDASPGAEAPRDPVVSAPSAPAPVRPKPVGQRVAVDAAAPRCSTGVAPFVPRRFHAQGVVEGADVLALSRDSRGVPGVPPVTTAGKDDVGFDAPGVAPGSARGNVVLTMHTWPDGSALGNRLLAGLQEGERLVLAAGRTRLCYRVTDRVEVPFDAPSDRAYDDEGPPQVVIIVCSGTRTGPGEWSHRTLWFASPVRG